MTGDDIDALRKVSVSQGIMLESVSERLAVKGGAHYRLARQGARRAA